MKQPLSAWPADLTEPLWRVNVVLGSLLEVFESFEDELSAPDPRPSGDEQPGSAESTSPITRPYTLNQLSGRSTPIYPALAKIGRSRGRSLYGVGEKS
jgi:hypothetical protein